jgi:large subunit ribosomal protein L18
MTRSIRQRRLKGKTDYKSRLALLKSQKPRLVVRKTNRYIVAQIVMTDVAQDKIVVGHLSKDLLDQGWPKESAGSLKSMQACYLTGLLLAKNASKNKIKNIILDLGMNRNVKKSRIYAVVKGAIEGGLEIPCNPDMLPTVEELKQNEKLGKIFDKLMKTI